MGGEASIEGDLYSFGILVLEILTEKRPTNEMFEHGLNLHNFVKTALPRRHMQIVDREVGERDQNEARARDQMNRRNYNLMDQNQMDANMEKCIVSLFNIGLACSVESPKERMNIRVVNRELHFIKTGFVGNNRINHGNGPRWTSTH